MRRPLVRVGAGPASLEDKASRPPSGAQTGVLRCYLNAADEERRRLTTVLAEKRGWWPWARRVGAAGVVWVVAHGAWAHDGNELLKHCLEPIETAESSYCLGYISGAADMLGKL